MRSFDPSAMASELVDQLLDPRLVARIDALVDQAMAAFSCTMPSAWTPESFDRILIMLVQHLSMHAMQPARVTLDFEAFAEAQILLDQSYETQSGRGYYAAVVDVCVDGTEAMKTVIAGIGEAFKEMRKRQAFQWTIRSAIDPLDWRQRCQLARFLAETGADHLPDAVRDCPPSQLAGMLVDLIMARFRVESYFREFQNQAGMN